MQYASMMHIASCICPRCYVIITSLEMDNNYLVIIIALM